MTRKRTSKPEELTDCRDTRIAQRCLEQHESYLSLLKHAQRIRKNYEATDILDSTIHSAELELQGFRTKARGNIFSRRRPKKPVDPSKSCIAFIDECGSYSLTSDDAFGAFILAAVVVPEENYNNIDLKWKDWKTANLSSPDKIIHEPDIRKCRGPFSFKEDTKKRDGVIASLKDLISALDFTAIVCVINRADYVAQLGDNRLDTSLPVHPYLMTMDFLMERLVLILENHFNCAKAKVIAEARGPLEDATLQYEYVRLQIDGTSYISPSWFRQQLSSSIDFKTKRDNCTGLQIADLLARPCGEKILKPTTTPSRWPEFRQKLCLGQETAHSILGLKILPWHERYIDIWKG